MARVSLLISTGRHTSYTLATTAAAPKANKPSTILTRGIPRTLKITYTIMAINPYRNSARKYVPTGTRVSVAPTCAVEAATSASMPRASHQKLNDASTDPVSKPAAQIHRKKIPVAAATAAPITNVSQAIRFSVAEPWPLPDGFSLECRLVLTGTIGNYSCLTKLPQDFFQPSGKSKASKQKR